MKKQRKLNLNKVSIVSLKNATKIIGGSHLNCPNPTQVECPIDPTTSNSTGPTDHGSTLGDSNTFSVDPEPPLSARGECQYNPE